MSPLVLLLLLAQDLLTQDQPTFRSDVALVHVDAEVDAGVREGGRPISGLGRESFRVMDEGKPQTILYFGHEEEPLDVLLLFDARMRPDIKRVADAAHTELGDLRQGGRVTEMTFGGSPGNCRTDLILDFTGDFEAAELSLHNRVLPVFESNALELCSTMAGLAGAASGSAKGQSPEVDHHDYGRQALPGPDQFCSRRHARPMEG